MSSYLIPALQHSPVVHADVRLPDRAVMQVQVGNVHVIARVPGEAWVMPLLRGEQEGWLSATPDVITALSDQFILCKHALKVK
ncbi:hypothetical protein E2C01_075772 [Portunus trituberculatus]|uniref:Uncharacterized protein n=1 Tax=Portunus trituberculatus TaxID=210409 RepID=A0A5B7IGM4_PORTR|nr:hypothetical protein [Portunus trituberculatus]